MPQTFDRDPFDLPSSVKPPKGDSLDVFLTACAAVNRRASCYTVNGGKFGEGGQQNCMVARSAHNMEGGQGELPKAWTGCAKPKECPYIGNDTENARAVGRRILTRMSGLF